MGEFIFWSIIEALYEGILYVVRGFTRAVKKLFSHDTKKVG